MQRNERMTLQSEQNELMKQDMEGFEKDLKASKKERKKTDNPMTKEEVLLISRKEKPNPPPLKD